MAIDSSAHPVQISIFRRTERGWGKHQPTTAKSFRETQYRRDIAPAQGVGGNVSRGFLLSHQSYAGDASAEWVSGRNPLGQTYI